jgi:hypothetical protein
MSEWKRDGRTIKDRRRDDVKGPIRCERVVGQERLVHREGMILWRSSVRIFRKLSDTESSDRIKSAIVCELEK